MVKKNRGTKIMAFLALFGIIIGVVGTGILIIFGGNNEQTITPEQYLEIQNLINAQSGSTVESGTGEVIIEKKVINTGTGVDINVSTGTTTLTGETE